MGCPIEGKGQDRGGKVFLAGAHVVLCEQHLSPGVTGILTISAACIIPPQTTADSVSFEQHS
jgi:hypothetical protein